MTFFAKAGFSQNFQFRTYSFGNSLSSYNAGKIVQDRYGFIWVCTQEGINRFDGRQFIAIKKDPIQNTALSENYVTDVARDEKGFLWIATALGGIDALDPENFAIERRLQEQKDKTKGLLTNWIRTLAFSAQKDLWIGTYYGLNIYNPERQYWSAMTSNPFNEAHDLNISFITQDSLHNIWVCAENDGIIIYNTATRQVISTISKKAFSIPEDQIFLVYGIYSDSPASTYACTNKGLKHLIFDGKKYLPDNNMPLALQKYTGMTVKAMIRDNQGRFWIGTEEGVAVTSEKGPTETLTHSNFFYNTLLDNNVNALFQDKFGNIWISTTKGLNQLINTHYSFQAFTAKTGGLSTMGNVNTIYPDNDSILYACAANGLFKVNIHSYQTKQLLKNDPYGEIESMLRIDGHGMLVSANQELLYIIQKGMQYKFIKASAVFKELAPAQYHYFSTIIRYNDSIILLGSMEDEGLFKWDVKHHVLQQFKSTNKKNGPYEDNFHHLKMDRKGNVWLLSNRSITRYDPLLDSFQNYLPRIRGSAAAPHFFFDLYDDGKYLWITTYGSGLIRYDLTEDSCIAFTEKDGFSSNAQYNILPENDSVAWISSNRGLTRFNFSSGVASRYYSADGLQSDAFDERSACKIGNTLFMGGLDGFTSIIPNKAYQAQHDIPVYVGKITFQDPSGQQRNINSLNLSSATFRLKGAPVTFQIISPDYGNITRNQYAYRIVELSGQWIQLGQSPDITLAGLSPGDYHFQARVSNSDHAPVYSDPILVTVLPEWYQTFLFKVGVVCLVILLFFLVYKIRVTQLKRQQSIRKDIASDLHDDIGSTLNSIKIFIHLVRAASESQEHIDRIKESLINATIGLRDMIWVLEDKNDSIDDLVTRIRNFAIPYTGAGNISFTCTCENMNNDKLRKTEKRNLLLIAKEAINNSVKYAQCVNIDVRFFKEGGRLCMLIRDDGKGLEHDAMQKGNGLRNMQLRAVQLKGECSIVSDKEGGTAVKVVVRK